MYRREAPNRTVDLTERTLTLRADTINEETRSVEAVLATERITTVFDWQRLEMIDESLRMSGAHFANQVVLLETHSRYSLETVLGSVRELRVEGDKLIGRLVFAEGDARSDAAWLKVRQGHITDVSIGYRVDRGGFRDVLPGQTITIDGKDIKAGARRLRITTSWTVREGSLVPIGADENAKLRQAEGGIPPKGDDHDDTTNASVSRQARSPGGGRRGGGAGVLRWTAGGSAGEGEDGGGSRGSTGRSAGRGSAGRGSAGSGSGLCGRHGSRGGSGGA